MEQSLCPSNAFRLEAASLATSSGRSHGSTLTPRGHRVLAASRASHGLELSRGRRRLGLDTLHDAHSFRASVERSKYERPCHAFARSQSARSPIIRRLGTAALYPRCLQRQSTVVAHAPDRVGQDRIGVVDFSRALTCGLGSRVLVGMKRLDQRTIGRSQHIGSHELTHFQHVIQRTFKLHGNSRRAVKARLDVVLAPSRVFVGATAHIHGTFTGWRFRTNQGSSSMPVDDGSSARR